MRDLLLVALLGWCGLSLVSFALLWALLAARSRFEQKENHRR